MSRHCSFTLSLGHRPGVMPLVADPHPTRTDSRLDNGYWPCTKDETFSFIYNSRDSDAVDITVENLRFMQRRLRLGLPFGLQATSLQCVNEHENWIALCERLTPDAQCVQEPQYPHLESQAV